MSDRSPFLSVASTRRTAAEAGSCVLCVGSTGSGKVRTPLSNAVTLSNTLSVQSSTVSIMTGHSLATSDSVTSVTTE